MAVGGRRINRTNEGSDGAASACRLRIDSRMNVREVGRDRERDGGKNTPKPSEWLTVGM
jgi:hypothetical protein